MFNSCSRVYRYVILSGVVAVLHPQVCFVLTFKINHPRSMVQIFLMQAAGKQRDISDPDFRDSQNRPLPAKNFALNSGIAFGEMALHQSMTRASYCCAETDVELIVVPKDACVQQFIFCTRVLIFIESVTQGSLKNFVTTKQHRVWIFYLLTCIYLTLGRATESIESLYTCRQNAIPPPRNACSRATNPRVCFFFSAVQSKFFDHL